VVSISDMVASASDMAASTSDMAALASDEMDTKKSHCIIASSI